MGKEVDDVKDIALVNAELMEMRETTFLEPKDLTEKLPD